MNAWQRTWFYWRMKLDSWRNFLYLTCEAKQYWSLNTGKDLSLWCLQHSRSIMRWWGLDNSILPIANEARHRPVNGCQCSLKSQTHAWFSRWKFALSEILSGCKHFKCRHNMLRCPGKFWQTSDLTCRLWDQWQDCSQISWGPEAEPLHHLAWTTRCVSFSVFCYLLQALLEFFSSQAKTHHWQNNCVAGIQENLLISITARALSDIAIHDWHMATMSTNDPAHTDSRTSTAIWEQ